MPDSFLLLSSPPHANANVVDLAPVFALTAAETRVKVNYPTATIWFADTDLPHLQGVAKQLMGSGANVRLIKGKSLTVLSKRHKFRRFAFAEGGLRCWVDEQRAIDIPYSWSVKVVSCRPMATESHQRLTMRQAAKAANPNKSIRQEARVALSGIKDHVDETFVDIYFYQLPKVHRFTSRPGETDFSGLGSSMKPTVRENITELFNQLSTRFSEADYDRTMENLPAPRALTIGGRSLPTILGEIDGSLHALDPYDLLSRLSFLAGAVK